nr:alkaline phosphatase family protein [Tersicoccus phoenicis]
MVNTGNLPAVSFLRAAQFQDGHAAYSDPVDEPRFITKTINTLQRSPDWGSAPSCWPTTTRTGGTTTSPPR